MISTPGGKIASNQLIRLVPIKLGSILINIDLILLPLEGIDVILGMNWMTQHGVVLDIPARVVELNSPKYGATTLYLPFRECMNSCAYAMTESKLENIPVVCECADVFLDDLPGMPPDREIEFVIELQPGTAPISKRPYRMPPKELAELKIQVQNLLDKGSICPSASPWSCPALFVKKKNDSLRLSLLHKSLPRRAKSINRGGFCKRLEITITINPALTETVGLPASVNLYYKDPKQLKVTFTKKKHPYPSQRPHLSEPGLWSGGRDRWFSDVPRCFRSNSKVFFTGARAYPPAHPPSLTGVDCGSLP